MQKRTCQEYNRTTTHAQSQDQPHAKRQRTSVSNSNEQKLTLQPQKKLEWVAVGVEFSVLSPEDIRRASVVRVSRVGEGAGSLNDPAMGAGYGRGFCQTCNFELTACGGHPGHIELAVPIINPMFCRELLQVLSCLCRWCGQYKGEIKTKSGTRISSHLEHTYNTLKRLSCKAPNCGKKSAIYQRNDTMERGRAVYKVGQHTDEIEPAEIRSILLCLTPAVIETMGFNHGAHPANYVMTVLPVMPPAFRPKPCAQVSFVAQSANATNLLQHAQKAKQNNKCGKEECQTIETDQKSNELQSNNTNSQINNTNSIPSTTTTTTATTCFLAPSAANKVDALYAPIITANARCEELIPLAEQQETGAQVALQAQRARLYDAVRTLFVSKQSTKGAGGGHKAAESIHSGFGGKEGLVRHDAQGKRQNHCGRFVVSPDATLRFDEVGVPAAFRATLSTCEYVTEQNLEYLRTEILRGNITHMCATKGRPCIIAAGDEEPAARALRPGFELDRALCDGDIVLINRQPTLSRGSYLAMRVRLRDAATLGLNPMHTPIFNADFDGDEMSVHVPQTLQAKAELYCLLLASRNIVSPANNAPAMYPILDDVAAVWLATQDNVKVDHSTWCDLLCALDGPALDRVAGIGCSGLGWLDNLHFRIRNTAAMFSGANQTTEITQKNLWHKNQWRTGRELFSALLPPDFCFRRGSVRVVTGVLVSGSPTKSVLGSSSGSILHHIAVYYGTRRAAAFLSDIPRVFGPWLRGHGLTVGVADMHPSLLSANFQGVREAAVRSALENADREPQPPNVLTAQCSNTQKTLQNEFNMFAPLKESTNSGGTAETRERNELSMARERRVVAHLNVANSVGEALASRAIPPTNSLRIMYKSGSKGSLFNISQIMGYVGQQFLDGARLPMQLNGGRRALSCFALDRNDAEARGFVVSSFGDGLSPSEFVAHARAARQGVCNTAMTTSEIGALTRLINKMVENVYQYYTGAVGDTFGRVVQFAYGDDGFDPARLMAVGDELEKPNCERILSFADVRSIAERLNAARGYLPNKC